MAGFMPGGSVGGRSSLDPLGMLGNIAKMGNPYLAGQENINPLAALLLSTQFGMQGPNGGFNFNGPGMASGMFMNKMLSQMMGGAGGMGERTPAGSSASNTVVDSPSMPTPASTPIIRTAPAGMQGAMRFGMGAPFSSGPGYGPPLPLMLPPQGFPGLPPMQQGVPQQAFSRNINEPPGY